MGQKEVYNYIKKVGSASVSEIALHENTTYATVNVYLYKMLKKGILERYKDEDVVSGRLVYLYKLKSDEDGA